MNWSGKRVLVTGAGGFIGSHLAERLALAGASVRALVKYNSAASWGWLTNSPHKDEMEIVLGDICDARCVQQAVADCEIIFHLAALIGIPYSYQAPASYVRTNIDGALNVLEAARQTGAERVVHTSTSEVYGTAQFAPITERHPLQSQSPYAATKIAADQLANAYFRSFDLPVTIVRPFNTFGPRQSARAVIPTIISQALAQPVVRLGSLSATRDLNFVANTVDAFLLASASKDAIGRTIHFGSGSEISIGELAQLIVSMTNSRATVVGDESRCRPPKSEVERLVADSSLASDVLGWTPKISLEDGLRQTISWVRENLSRFRPDVYTM